MYMYADNNYYWQKMTRIWKRAIRGIWEGFERGEKGER